MEYKELSYVLAGFYAFDTGSVDSGIHDEVLRKKVEDYLVGLKPIEHKKLIAKIVWDLCLSDEAIEAGYGPEDAKSFLEWLDERMGCLVRDE